MVGCCERRGWRRRAAAAAAEGGGERLLLEAAGRRTRFMSLLVYPLALERTATASPQNRVPPRPIAAASLCSGVLGLSEAVCLDGRVITLQRRSALVSLLEAAAAHGGHSVPPPQLPRPDGAQSCFPLPCCASYSSRVIFCGRTRATGGPSAPANATRRRGRRPGSAAAGAS